MDKVGIINAIKVADWKNPTLPDLGDSINDTKIICSDGYVLVERSFLCWSSKVFWRIFKSEVGTIKREDDLWIVKLPDDEKKIVEMAYQISKRLFVKLPVNYDGRTDDQTTTDLIQFAHQYEFMLLLDLLKRAITGLINPCFSKSKQCYFDLDSKLGLGIRQHLIKAWFYQTLLLKPDQWENVEVFEDLEIYNEIFKIAFILICPRVHLKGTFLPLTPEVLHIQKMAIISFIFSELDFRRMSDDLRRRMDIPPDFNGFPFEPITDPILQREKIDILLKICPIEEKSDKIRDSNRDINELLQGRLGC